MLKWYWVVLIAVVVFIVIWALTKRSAITSSIKYQKDLNSQISSVLNQLSNQSATGRISGTAINSLIAERDRLLKLKNPTPQSANLLVDTPACSQNNQLWNGWTCVNVQGLKKVNCTNVGGFWVYNPTTGTYSCVKNASVI